MHQLKGYRMDIGVCQATSTAPTLVLLFNGIGLIPAVKTPRLAVHCLLAPNLESLSCAIPSEIDRGKIRPVRPVRTTRYLGPRCMLGDGRWYEPRALGRKAGQQE